MVRKKKMSQLLPHRENRCSWHTCLLLKCEKGKVIEVADAPQPHCLLAFSEGKCKAWFVGILAQKPDFKSAPFNLVYISCVNKFLTWSPELSLAYLYFFYVSQYTQGYTGEKQSHGITH